MKRDQPGENLHTALKSLHQNRSLDHLSLNTNDDFSSLLYNSEWTYWRDIYFIFSHDLAAKKPTLQ